MIMTLMYFRSQEDLKRFYGKAHGKGSRFSRDNGRLGTNYIGLYQENYRVGKGEWDAFGGEIEPAMLGEFCLCLSKGGFCCVL